MKCFVPILALLGAVSANDGLTAKWSAFKASHGKSYAAHVESARLQAFSASLRLIDDHNAKFARGEVTYELGLNALSDLTPEEIRASKFGAVINASLRASLNATEHVMSDRPSASYIDWRQKNGVTGVRSQASCGSCYTFSSAAAIESTLMRKNQGNNDLSEQDLVDCTYNRYQYGLNFGCGGGDPATTISHALRTGLASEAAYPYTSGTSKTQGQCRSPARKTLGHLRMISVAANENALADAVQRGPIAVTLNGENNEFYNYRGGIYNNPACSTQINHAVLLVGVGQQNGQEYWIIKNSWGSTWGEGGFMKIAKGYNRCGIVSQLSYYVD